MDEARDEATQAGSDLSVDASKPSSSSSQQQPQQQQTDIATRSFVAEGADEGQQHPTPIPTEQPSAAIPTAFQQHMQGLPEDSLEAVAFRASASEEELPAVMATWRFLEMAAPLEVLDPRLPPLTPEQRKELADAKNRRRRQGDDTSKARDE